MELLDLKIGLAQSLIDTPCVMCFTPTTSPSASKKERENVDSATLERLKTKHTFIVMLVEFFCDSFPTTYLESVLKILIPKFQDNK